MTKDRRIVGQNKRDNVTGGWRGTGGIAGDRGTLGEDGRPKGEEARAGVTERGQERGKGGEITLNSS